MRLCQMEHRMTKATHTNDRGELLAQNKMQTFYGNCTK